MFDFSNTKAKKKVIAVVAVILIISMVLPTVMALL